jgi:uncharacterized membrane protein
MTEAEERRPEAGKELDRIIFFSDAVFAIAITILVLDIRVPDGLSPTELPAVVLGLGPRYVSYLISFLVLAVYWQAHPKLRRNAGVAELPLSDGRRLPAVPHLTPR